MLARLLEGQSGLLDDAGADYFAGRFSHLPRSGIDLYPELCDLLFHGQGRLHVVYLTAGEGELHLRVADYAPFGVVNVGDSVALYNLLTENASGDFDVDREQGFAARLFADVDRPDSTVNVVVGARRFIAGWNSWRVSTMGLMHVGVGEGPEIIQMFGRGVRLQGWNMSLKRHRESEAELPPDSAGLQELETLYIFGLRANYMQMFRDLLKAEGMRVDRETITLPVTWTPGGSCRPQSVRTRGCGSRRRRRPQGEDLAGHPGGIQDEWIGPPIEMRKTTGPQGRGLGRRQLTASDRKHERRRRRGSRPRGSQPPRAACARGASSCCAVPRRRQQRLHLLQHGTLHRLSSGTGASDHIQAEVETE